LVYIDFEDDRGKCVGAVHLDDPEGDVLEFPAYAMFLDPGSARVVRSNGNVSKKISAGMSAEQVRQIKSESDGHILDTNMVRFNIAKNPALKSHISKGFSTSNGSI
jgi:hypothetical protein